MKTALVVLLGLLISSAAWSSPTDPLTKEKEQDIRAFIEITNGPDMAVQYGREVTKTMAETLQQMVPNLPNEVLDIVVSESGKLMEEKMKCEGGLFEMLVPVYDRYFTHGDIRDLLKFYRSDIGRKYVRLMPDLSRDAAAAGKEWGARIQPELDRRIEKALREKGY